MKKSKQYDFVKARPRFFGGALLVGRRKSLRPLSSKDSIHFVLRSQWATGRDSFLAVKNKKSIERIIKKFASRFGVKIYHQAINSNHIHLLLMITNRYFYRAFIKAVSGLIASHVMAQQSFKQFLKSRQVLLPGDGGQGFWQFRPFSRVVSWGRDFKACFKYVEQNVLEALGVMPYKPRKNYYAKWLKPKIKWMS